MGDCSNNITHCESEYMISLFLMVIPFCLVLIILFKTVYSFYCDFHYDRPIVYYQIASITSYILGLGCILCDFIHIMQSWLIPMPLRSSHFKILRMWANILAFNSYIATDSVIFGRLYFSFKDSVYKLSKCTLIIILFVLMVIIACDILFIIEKEFLSIRYIDREDILLSFTIIELIFSVSISLMFTIKLHQLLSLSTTDRYHKLIASNKSPSNLPTHFDFNEIQKRLLNLSTKNAIITGIAAIYFAIRFGYRQFAARYDETGDLEIIWMISYTARTYIFVTNGISVYFGFVFTQKTYYKLCKSCHLCMFGFCAFIARRNITKHAIEQIARNEYIGKNENNYYHQNQSNENDTNNPVLLGIGGDGCYHHHESGSSNSLPLNKTPKGTSVNTIATETTLSIESNL